MADDVGAGSVRSDRKFADAIAVFIGARVGAKFIAQILVLRAKIDNPIVLDLDSKRVVLEIAEAFAKIIADHTIDDENTVGVLRRSKNLAAGKIAPFVLSDNAAGLEPFEFRRKLGLEFRAVWSFAGNPFDLACTVDQTLTKFVDF